MAHTFNQIFTIYFLIYENMALPSQMNKRDGRGNSTKRLLKGLFPWWHLLDAGRYGIYYGFFNTLWNSNFTQNLVPTLELNPRLYQEYSQNIAKDISKV